MSRRHGALHLASAQYPTTREGNLKARWHGGLPERTQCTQVSCGTPPVSVRLLHLNDHVRILLQLGWQSQSGGMGARGLVRSAGLGWCQGSTEGQVR
jgi:hypothetical protein